MTPDQKFLMFIVMVIITVIVLAIWYLAPLFEESRQRRIAGEEKCDAFCLKINMTPQENSYGGMIGSPTCYCERVVMCIDDFCHIDYERFDIESRGDV